MNKPNNHSFNNKIRKSTLEDCRSLTHLSYIAEFNSTLKGQNYSHETQNVSLLYEVEVDKTIRK